MAPNDDFKKAMEPVVRLLDGLGKEAAARPSAQPPSAQVQRLVSLHRYWRYSDRLYDLYRWSLKNKSPLDGKSLDEVVQEFIVDFNGDVGLFMSYWYGALHVVVEGYEQLGLHDPAIDAMITGEGTSKLGQLRRARHATFHFQAEMMSKKLWEFLSIDNVPWVVELHEGLGRAIMAEIDRLLATPAAGG